MKHNSMSDTKLNSELKCAARKGDTAKVQLLINEPQVHFSADDYNTAMVVAAANGHREIVRLMLEQGCQIEDPTLDAP